MSTQLSLDGDSDVTVAAAARGSGNDAIVGLGGEEGAGRSEIALISGGQHCTVSVTINPTSGQGTQLGPVPSGNVAAVQNGGSKSPHRAEGATFGSLPDAKLATPRAPTPTEGEAGGQSPGSTSARAVDSTLGPDRDTDAGGVVAFTGSTSEWTPHEVPVDIGYAETEVEDGRVSHSPGPACVTVKRRSGGCREVPRRSDRDTKFVFVADEVRARGAIRPSSSIKQPTSTHATRGFIEQDEPMNHTCDLLC